jgi:carboxymethylenebutenolidase
MKCKRNLPIIEGLQQKSEVIMFRKSIMTVFIFLLGFPVNLPALQESTGKPHHYLSLPQNREGKVPGIILIHEWWGLNDQMIGLADQFAGLGYAALAVDLYQGQSAATPEEAHELMRGLPEDRALKTLKEAAAFLKTQDAVDGERVAVIGWCMGGGYALQMALEEPSLKAAVMYYGRLVTDENRLAELEVPLLGIFGAEDRGISADSVRDFKHTLEKHTKRAEIHLYEGAGHAFANPNNPGYQAEAAADAWEKTKVFLKQNLI